VAHTEINGSLLARTMSRPARLEANQQAEDNADLHRATPASTILSAWGSRGLRVGNPRSRTEDHRERRKLVIRYQLPRIASEPTVGTFSYLFSRRSNSSSRYT
jgi:hypothetical protein